jgi:hypothetical protein
MSFGVAVKEWTINVVFRDAAPLTRAATKNLPTLYYSQHQ